MLTQLELRGILRPLGTFYASYQFRLLEPEARVLAGHKPERQAFLRRLFAAGAKGTKWTTLNPDEAAEALGEARERVLKALTWLEEAGEIELKPSKPRQRYRLCDDRERRDPETISQEMQALFTGRELRDLQRLDEVLALAEHRGCLTRWLLRYFGEALDHDCGTCTSCQENKTGAAAQAPREIPCMPTLSFDSQQLEAIRRLVQERHPALRAPRQLARFLCGLTSPATSRARLTQLDTFGLLERMPFAEVLAQVETTL